MNNIEKLNADVKQNNQKDTIKFTDTFPNIMELTDEEKERIDKMKKDTEVVVEETGGNNTSVKTPVEEYAKTLDDRIATLKNNDELKFINSYGKNSDITKTIENEKQEAKENVMSTFKTFALNKETTMSDDQLLTLNDQAITALQTYFKLDRLNSDIILPKLKKLTIKQIADILPPEFVKLFLTTDDIKFNKLKAKDNILAVISYLITTGPDLDYLNDYIDEENKLALVSKRLLQCQMDFVEMVKDKDKLSKIVAESVIIEPIDTSFWAKYIKIPNKVHNEFAQRVIIFKKYKEAYSQILTEYASDEKSCALIQEEIDECDNKIEVYQNVCDLKLMKSLATILIDRYESQKKRLNISFIRKECIDAIDRIKKSKLNVSFPAYETTVKRSDKILNVYESVYPKMVQVYNTNIINIKEKESGETNIIPIKIDGCNDSFVETIFSYLVLILMGRIMKALSKNPMSKYNAIMLDAYFQIFCKMGSDIYLMNEVWLMLKDFIDDIVGCFSLESKR